jgi:rhodanese-related sulfurtransferase
MLVSADTPLVSRIGALEARERVESGQALLVCAYEEEGKCRRNRLGASITLAELRERDGTLPVDQELIFYCACVADDAAIERAREYSSLGFTNVMVLDRGVSAWREACLLVD